MQASLLLGSRLLQGNVLVFGGRGGGRGVNSTNLMSWGRLPTPLPSLFSRSRSSLLRAPPSASPRYPRSLSLSHCLSVCLSLSLSLSPSLRLVRLPTASPRASASFHWPRLAPQVQGHVSDWLGSLCCLRFVDFQECDWVKAQDDAREDSSWHDSAWFKGL